VTTTVTEDTTAAGTTNPDLSPSEGRPDAGAAAALVGELYAAHGRMVLGLCRLLLRDPVEAEDATQQVFISAQHALLGGAVPREPVAWLAAIARNECRARIRARMREPLALPDLPADIPDPLASAIRTADLDAVWAALSALPRRQRKALLLREVGGLSYEELGVALGVTRPAVESLLFRARQHIRFLLSTVNTALVPVALREQLTRLLPLGSPTGGAPFAAKVAAVTVGVGLGAAGAVELPTHHGTHVLRSRAPVVAPPTLSTRPDSHDGVPATALWAARVQAQPQDRHRGPEARRRDNEADHEREHRGREAAEPAEPEPEEQVPEPQQAEEQEQEHSVPAATVDEEAHGGDGGHSGSGGGESGDSGSHDGESSGGGD